MVIEISKQQLERIKGYQIELETQNELLRRTREKLAVSLGKYTDLYDYSPLGYVTLDERLVIVEANLTIASMLGIKRLDMLGTDFLSYIVEEDRKEFLKSIVTLQKKYNSRKCEGRLKSADGTLLESRFSCIYREQGDELMFRVAVTDITTLKETEEKLQEAVNLNRLFLDALPCTALLIEHGTYRIIAANQKAAARGAVAGSTCYATLGDSPRPCSCCLAPQIVRGGEENARYWSGNRYVDVYWKAVDSDTLYLLYMFDITEQQKVKEALEEAHRELENRVRERTRELQQSHVQLMHAEKLAAVGNLSASIAHEFNNPLQSVTTILQGVKNYAELAAKEEKLIDVAIQECSRMRDLIKSLGDFYRPTSGMRELVELQAIIDGLLLLTKKDCSNRKIDIRKNFAENIPPVMGVVDQLKQVFLNLLTNAADACTEGGTITVTTERQEKQVVVHIEDTGEGISPEHLPRIFEPFFTTKSKKSGTGLGLSITYGIIKEHGGDITVESEVDTGTTFSVFLPIQGVNNDQKNTAGG